jgi:hypothetical protein
MIATAQTTEIAAPGYVHADKERAGLGHLPVEQSLKQLDLFMKSSHGSVTETMPHPQLCLSKVGVGEHFHEFDLGLGAATTRETAKAARPHHAWNLILSYFIPSPMPAWI